MTVYPQASLSLLVITSATLFWTAYTDFRDYKIRNEFVLVLAGLYFAHALVSGRWTFMHWNVAFAALMFAGMLYGYLRKQMGGGDLKLLTVVFLWTGPHCVAPFAVLLLLFIGVHYAAAQLKWVSGLRTTSGLMVPLAPSVAAALIGTFALGCLAPTR